MSAGKDSSLIYVISHHCAANHMFICTVQQVLFYTNHQINYLTAIFYPRFEIAEVAKWTVWLYMLR